MSFGVLFVIANIVVGIIIWFLRSVREQRVLVVICRIIISCYCVFLLSFIIVEYFILHEAYSKDSFDTEKIDFVIILGAGLRGEEPSKTLQGRLDAGLDFLLKNKNIPVIVSGGQGPGESITEAEAMGRYLIRNGIVEERIYFESLSTDTFENIDFSNEIMKQLGVEKPTVLIITSDYHLFRAKLLAEEKGLLAYGLGGDSPFFVKVNYFIREYFGIVKDLIFQHI